MNKENNKVLIGLNKILLILRISILIVILCVFILLAIEVFFSRANTESSSKKPNVLFIIADDLNVRLGTYGHPLVKSPNIDALAERGTRFERAYCQFPLCNPSRTSLFTGLRPKTTGVQRNSTYPREKIGNRLFMPEYFQTNGYRILNVGKTIHEHFQETVIKSWDAFYTKESLGSVSDPKCRDKIICGTRNKDEDEYDGRIARKAAELLERYKDQQFMLCVGFSLPHTPRILPQKYFDLYEIKDIPLPTGWTEGNETETKEKILSYYAAISFIDAQIGLLIEKLDDLHLSENTIIILTSDHGYSLGEHGIFDKKNLYNETTRVPLIVVNPRSKDNNYSTKVVELVDIYPTLIELCDLPSIDDLEGDSLVPLLQDENVIWKTEVFSETILNQRSSLFESVITDRFLFFQREDGKREKLFDLWYDKDQLNNLANNPNYADIVQLMRNFISDEK